MIPERLCRIMNLRLFAVLRHANLSKTLGGVLQRVLMINPPALVTNIWQLIQYPEPYPYGLLKLAALLARQGVSCELIDMMEYNHHTEAFFTAFPDNLTFHSEKATGSPDVKRSSYYLGKTPDWLEEQLAGREPPDEVWVSCCLSFNYQPAHEVIAVVKKTWPRTTVKFGGIYPTLLPDHAALSLADEVVPGKNEEAEDLFGDYSLYETPPPVGLYNFATGCPNRCSFCVNHHQKPKLRSGAEEVLSYFEELSEKYGIKHFSNWDPNVMVYRDELTRLLTLVADSQLECTLSFDMGIQCNRLTLELAQKMKRAGVSQVTVPFETTDPVMYKHFRKPYRSHAPIRAILTLKEAGFDITKQHCCSLFGFANEDPRHLYRTYLSIVGLGVRPIFSPYAPVPTSLEWERVWPTIADKPIDELNGYLFPLMDSPEKVLLYEKLIELFHTWDIKVARKLVPELPGSHQRLFEEELDFVSGELAAMGHEFHVPKDEVTENWQVEGPQISVRSTVVDLVLVVPPANDEQIMPELGPAQIESYLEERGLNVRQLDMNQVFLDSYFERRHHRYEPRATVRRYLETLPGEYEGLTDLALREHPLFDAFFKGVLFQHWKTAPPRVLGISMLSAGQILPSLRLGALVRQYWGDVPILWGGPYAAPAEGIFKRLLEDERFPVDGFATYGGERALEAVLCRPGEPRARFGDAPGLVSRGPNGIVEGPKAEVIPLRELGSPSFDALPLKSYLAPSLPVPTALGCFSGKCKFCHHRIRRPDFDPLEGKLVAAHMIKLADKYGATSFFMADHATRAQTMREVAEELIRAERKLNFSAMARAETEFSEETLDTIRRGGGRMLFVGLESASQEFLDLMNKGITVEQVETLCRRAKRVGMYVVLFILDLPSRPAQEVLDTIQWCIDRADIIHDVVYQRFVLSRDVLGFTDPQELGIEPTVDPETWTDVYNVPYRSLSPRTAEETTAIDAKRLQASELFLKKKQSSSGRGDDIWVECHTL